MGILEHHLRLSPELAQGEARAHGPPVEPHIAFVGNDKMQQEARRRRLAAAGFADDAKGLAPVGGERHVLNRPHGRCIAREITLADGEMLRQSSCFDQRRRRRGEVGRHCSFTSSALRRLSLSWLKQKEVRKIITPGRTATPGLIQIDWRSVFSMRPQSGVGG